MDCDHGNGPQAIREQRRIARLIARRWQGTLLETPLGGASIDVLFARDGELVSIGEVKVRALTWRELVALGSYLVTHDKLLRGRELARLLGVPFDLFVSLRDDVIGWWRIAHATGAWATRFEVRTTDTQATCNGGRARRANAYLDLRDCSTWHVAHGRASSSAAQTALETTSAGDGLRVEREVVRRS